MNSKYIGNKVLYDTNISVKARLLMLFLLEASNEEGEDYLDISISFLCKALGYSNKTIIIDYLTSRADVGPERIGILGICGWGGFALNAAANDPRIKATVTSTMYDMSRVNANGYFDAMSSDDRYKLREQLNAQRTEDYRDDSYVRDGGVLDPVTDDTPQFVKEYHDYYKTERGYHLRSPNSNEGITKTSVLSFINMPLLTYISEIRSAVLMIHGEKAHSRYFSEDAYKRLTGSNKELLIIPGANHVDLYDNLNVLPFDKIDAFFKNALKEK